MECIAMEANLEGSKPLSPNKFSHSISELPPQLCSSTTLGDESVIIPMTSTPANTLQLVFEENMKALQKKDIKSVDGWLQYLSNQLPSLADTDKLKRLMAKYINKDTKSMNVEDFMSNLMKDEMNPGCHGVKNWLFGSLTAAVEDAWLACQSLQSHQKDLTSVQILLVLLQITNSLKSTLNCQFTIFAQLLKESNTTEDADKMLKPSEFFLLRDYSDYEDHISSKDQIDRCLERFEQLKSQAIDRIRSNNNYSKLQLAPDSETQNYTTGQKSQSESKVDMLSAPPEIKENSVDQEVIEDQPPHKKSEPIILTENLGHIQAADKASMDHLFAQNPDLLAKFLPHRPNALNYVPNLPGIAKFNDNIPTTYDASFLEIPAFAAASHTKTNIKLGKECPSHVIAQQELENDYLNKNAGQFIQRPIGVNPQMREAFGTKERLIASSAGWCTDLNDKVARQMSTSLAEAQRDGRKIGLHGQFAQPDWVSQPKQALRSAFPLESSPSKPLEFKKVTNERDTPGPSGSIMPQSFLNASSAHLAEKLQEVPKNFTVMDQDKIKLLHKLQFEENQRQDSPPSDALPHQLSQIISKHQAMMTYPNKGQQMSAASSLRELATKQQQQALGWPPMKQSATNSQRLAHSGPLSQLGQMEVMGELGKPPGLAESSLRMISQTVNQPNDNCAWLDFRNPYHMTTAINQMQSSGQPHTTQRVHGARIPSIEAFNRIPSIHPCPSPQTIKWNESAARNNEQLQETCEVEKTIPSTRAPPPSLEAVPSFKHQLLAPFQKALAAFTKAPKTPTNKALKDVSTSKKGATSIQGPRCVQRVPFDQNQNQQLLQREQERVHMMLQSNDSPYLLSADHIYHQQAWQGNQQRMKPLTSNPPLPPNNYRSVQPKINAMASSFQQFAPQGQTNGPIGLPSTVFQSVNPPVRNIDEMAATYLLGMSNARACEAVQCPMPYLCEVADSIPPMIPLNAYHNHQNAVTRNQQNKSPSVQNIMRQKYNVSPYGDCFEPPHMRPALSYLQPHIYHPETLSEATSESQETRNSGTHEIIQASIPLPIFHHPGKHV